MKRTTSAGELFLSVARRGGVSLRVQLERTLRLAIQQGRLEADALVPSTRALAADLGLSRGVVVEAYEQLLAEGYLRAAHGSGTRVAYRRVDVTPAETAAAAEAPPAYDFRPGLPDLALFPRRAWLMAMRRALARAPGSAFDYPDPRGAHPAREALAAYLNRVRATRAHADNVVFFNGSAQGIGLVCRLLRERGVRRLGVEDPGHADQCTDIQAAGLVTPRIPVDDRGLRVDRLERADADAVLVTPAHQFPTGAALAPERRAALLEWAGRRRAVVIEDDYDAEYRYDREPVGALQGLAPERVVYVGSASKTLSPALRLGWVVAPRKLVDGLADAKLHADRGSPAPEQLALGEFIQSGEFDRHIRKTRLIYRKRHDVLAAALKRHLPRLRVHGVAAGLHVYVELPSGRNERAIVDAARQRSIRVFGAASYRARPSSGPPALVVGYGALQEERIDEAVRQLARVLGEVDRLTISRATARYRARSRRLAPR
jgi:GntR family transcriptional regulator/MocR family aminotransferase